MGSEQVLKKTVLGGFKKEGVLNYIEQLQTEIIELKKEISNKSDYSYEIDNLKSEKEAVINQTAAITAKYDAAKAENESLSETNACLTQELYEAKMLILEYENKQKIFEEKISLIENKFSQLENGFTRGGADNSLKIKEAAAEAKINVADANDRLKTACNNFESSTASLKSCVENLLNILTELSE